MAESLRSDRDRAATVAMAVAPAIFALIVARVHLRAVGHLTRWHPSVPLAQAVFVLVGLGVGVALAVAGPTRLARDGRWFLAATLVALLWPRLDPAHIRVLGLVITPTELAKVGIVLAGAAALGAEGRTRAAGLGAVAVVVVVVGARDFTSAVVLGTSLLAAAWVAMPQGRAFVGPLAVASGVAFAATGVVAARLPPYQRARLDVWLSGGDPRGAGWLGAQVRAALREAGLGGTGSYPRFADVFEHNDLGLVDLAARFGLAAVIVVTLVHLGIALFALHAAGRAKDRFGVALATATAGVFAWHGLGNVAMAAGLLPFSNLRLGLVSYGGSSVVTLLALLGATTGVALTGSDAPAYATHARLHTVRLALCAVGVLVVVRMGFLLSGH